VIVSKVVVWPEALEVAFDVELVLLLLPLLSVESSIEALVLLEVLEVLDELFDLPPPMLTVDKVPSASVSGMIMSMIDVACTAVGDQSRSRTEGCKSHAKQRPHNASFLLIFGCDCFRCWSGADMIRLAVACDSR